MIFDLTETSFRDIPIMVGGEGFEPSKAEPTDLQSAVFDRFTIHPSHLLTLFVRPFDVHGAHLTSSSAHHLYSSRALAVMFVRSLPKSINNFWVLAVELFSHHTWTRPAAKRTFSFAELGERR
ncbi:MAG: hypothetical protein QG607_204 [Patescibacteria group bacterium]|nr:hypothetical protein [Patescibacteria group bacterium]